MQLLLCTSLFMLLPELTKGEALYHRTQLEELVERESDLFHAFGTMPSRSAPPGGRPGSG